MKTPDQPPQPNNNFLSIEDFRILPKNITEYKIGDQLTRENFTSFLIQSFAISRGSSKIHLAFFMWLERKFKFNYRETLRLFMVSGGWNVLAKEEKDNFKKAFRAIGKHTTTKTLEEQTKQELKGEVETEATIAEEIQDQIGYLDNVTVLPFELEGVDTLEQFKAKFTK